MPSLRKSLLAASSSARRWSSGESLTAGSLSAPSMTCASTGWGTSALAAAVRSASENCGAVLVVTGADCEVV